MGMSHVLSQSFVRIDETSVMWFMRKGRYMIM